MTAARRSTVTASACCWLLLLLMASSASARSLRQEVSGCSGSIANTLVAGLAAKADDAVSLALAAAWPSVQSELDTKLANIDVNQHIASKPVSLKKCILGSKVCVGFTAKLEGSVRVSNGTITNLSTPTVQVANITCAPPASKLSLSVAASTTSAFNLTADSITLDLSGSVVATASTLYLGLSGSLPVSFNGVLSINGLEAQAQASANIKGTYAIKGSTLSYSLAITSIQGVQLGASSASYAGSRLPADGPAADMTKQVEEYVSGLILSAVNDFISQQLEDALNSSLGDVTYKGTIKI